MAGKRESERDRERRKLPASDKGIGVGGRELGDIGDGNVTNFVHCIHNVYIQCVHYVS